MKYWLILLKKWRAKNKRGLTVPFLIGSGQYYNDSMLTIQELIYEINESEEEIYITYCTDINELIIGVKDENLGNFEGKYLSNSSFFISKIVKDNLSNFTIEALITHLYQLYEYELNRERYSKIDEQTWGPFTQNDLTFIKSES